MGRDYSGMTVKELDAQRQLVLDRIAAVPQFRRGSLQVGYRKCGKKNCRCAKPGEKGHGPRGLWTRTAKGPGGSNDSRGQYIPVDQVDQVRTELDNFAQFSDLIADYIEVNEELCKAEFKPTRKKKPRTPADLASGEEKGGPVPTKK